MVKFPKIFKRLKIIGCGCLIIFIILIILGLLFSGVIIRRVISGVIQQKTGVNVNVDNLNNGQMTYTDPKTGAKLNIGENKIPEDFPKDFPIYPNASVTSSLSGNPTTNLDGKGFWLTLSTKDSVDSVISYYETNLKTNGWTFNQTQGTGSGTNWAVAKGDLSGYLTIDKPAGQTQTAILIILGGATPASK